MKSLDTYWYSQNPVAWILLPVSWLYCALVKLRRWLYQLHFLKSYKSQVPVIVIGNISVGGTGKTPLIVAICELLNQSGLKPGIVSRGYGGEFTGEKIIEPGDTAANVGDEPLMLARKTACPVAVGKDRFAAVQQLLKNKTCDIVLSDDGLQHYRLHRDIEIAVVDSQRKFGNGFCIPAGPLRESTKRLKEVDIVVYNGNSDEKLGFTLEFTQAINLKTGESRALLAFNDTEIHAVAGIGNPDRFFKQLKLAGLTIIEHAFPDHHVYTKDDLSPGFNLADESEINKTILMTEKDAVKCEQMMINNIWYIPVKAVLSSDLIQYIKTSVQQLANA